MTTTATATSAAPAKRPALIPWRLFEELFGLAFLTWIGFTITVLGITLGIAAFGEVTGSVWGPASQVPRWFAFFIGLHLAMDIAPLYIAHGQTRREFAKRAVIFMAMFAAATGVLITAGFVIERVIYAIAGWPQTISEIHLYTSATDYGRIFLEHGLWMLVWTAGGALIGVGFYRDNALGALTIVIGILAAALTGVAIGSFDGWGPSQLLGRLLGAEPPPLIVSLLGAFTVFAGLLALTWRLVRDIPLRNKTA